MGEDTPIVDVPMLNVLGYCDNLRDKLKSLESEVREFANDLKIENISGDKGEQIANAILSLRHIEDARMRLGKVIQYNGDGVSKYDK